MKLCVKKDSLDTLGTRHQASVWQVQGKCNGKCSQLHVGKASANNVPEGSGDVVRHTHQYCTGLGRVELNPLQMQVHGHLLRI